METGRDLILVSGATGQQGGTLARKLLARGHKVRAGTRKPQGAPARALKELGAEVVAFDMDDAASIEKAVAGAWGVFSVQNTWEAGVQREEEQGKRLAQLARKGGVQHFVYSSVGSAHKNTGIPHFDNKWRIEEAVRGLSFPSWTILRPVFFMENFTSPWFKPAILQGKVTVGIKPDTKLQMIALDDIGEFGLRAFEEERLKNRALDIAGDERTMGEVAAVISVVTGKNVQFAPTPIEEVRKQSPDFAAMLEWFDRVGYEADIPRLQTEFGFPLTEFDDWAHTVTWS